MDNLINKNFWEGKKILITGHTGFKGSWLSLILSNLNAEIYGLSLNQKSQIYKTIKKRNLFRKEIFCDINQINKSFKKELLSTNFDIIFHFAAQSLVGTAYLKPLETINTNVLGTFKVLELFNEIENSKVLSIATSDKVYKKPNILNKETSELGWSEYYSASKYFSENLVKLFQFNNLKNGKYINVIRSGNVIGGGDKSENRLIPDVLKALNSNSHLNLRNPNAIRPWQHVLDSLYGYLLAVQYTFKAKENTIYNLNSKLNNSHNVGQIVDEMLKIWNKNLKVNLVNSYSEVDSLIIDSSKALKELGWEAKLDIKKSLELIYKWEKANNKYLETENQINQYLKNLVK